MCWNGLWKLIMIKIIFNFGVDCGLRKVWFFGCLEFKDDFGERIEKICLES